MFPRRCKGCKCYVAPQLLRCPRCGEPAPAILGKQEKEDRATARAKRDAKAPTIKSKSIHWVPSKFSLKAHANTVDEIKRRIAKEESVVMRNVFRSELRSAKALLARAEVPDGKKAWTSGIHHTKQQCVPVFINPKGRWYVTASRDEDADLIVINPKTRKFRGRPVSRLRLFEKSVYARMKKAEKKEEATNKKRKKAKKDKHAKKRSVGKDGDT